MISVLQGQPPQSNFTFHDPCWVRYPFHQLWANVVLQALWRARLPRRCARSAVTVAEAADSAYRLRRREFVHDGRSCVSSGPEG